MRVAIAYQSSYGHNRIIAEHLVRALQSRGHEALAYDVKKSSPADTEGADLFIFSSPTHIGRAPRRMRAFLKGLVENEAGKPYALVCTKLPAGADSSHDILTLESMQDILLGNMVHLDSLSLDSLKIKGPLREGFEQKLDSFLDDVLSKL
jgi:menaquinone-dependent protoporphyrinogen IX oxidase